MKLIETALKDCWIIEPSVFKDSRGLFLETYNANMFAKHGLRQNFVQDNMSVSTKKTLRGFHLQRGEAAQTKLVWVASGAVLDIVVDLRPDSLTFKQSISVALNSETFTQLLIPKGFAHGFVCLSQTAVFCYKVDNFYSKDHELGFRFDDPELNIALPFGHDELIVSDKDRHLPLLKDIEALL